MIYAGKCKTLMLSSMYQREGFVLFFGSEACYYENVVKQ